MKLNINRIRAIVFMIAAFGYLPLQSAEHKSEKQSIKTDVKIEQIEKAPAKSQADLVKS